VIRPSGVEVTAVRDGQHLQALLRDELGADVSDEEAQRLFRDARAD
jgi:hypothetical protein